MSPISQAPSVSPVVSFQEIDENNAGQRIDNFLLKILKGVPKSHIYRILRSGEVRVNKGRIDASYKLAAGDVVRVPPVKVAEKAAVAAAPAGKKLEPYTIFEDDALLVLNKPAGLAVHGGSGISRGVIEQLRLERPKAKFLELVHRLDRETSGVLLLAKKRQALVSLHEAIRNNQTDKRYLVLVAGEWQEAKKRVVLNLQKYVLSSGERRVNVVGKDTPQAAHADAQVSETMFYLKQSFQGFSLLEARLVTGRTHQLRVQLAHLGFPIVGDDKYGDFALNKQLQKRGMKRMFLHSAETNLRHPVTGEKLHLEAALPQELINFLNTLEPSKKA